jgi:hypothetical protein
MRWGGAYVLGYRRHIGFQSFLQTLCMVSSAYADGKIAGKNKDAIVFDEIGFVGYCDVKL